MPSVAATAVMSGVSPSITTEPRSPETAPAFEESSSAVIVPAYAETERSDASLSPSAIVVMKLRVVEPVPEK